MRPSVFIAALVVAASSSLPARAAEFFETQRAFRVDRACIATSSPRVGAETVTLDAGQMLIARGVDRKASPQYVFVRIGDVSKWISLACGAFTDDDTGGAPRGKAPAG